MVRLKISRTFLLLSLYLNLGWARQGRKPKSRCELIQRDSLCENSKYNLTMFPNHFGDQQQREATKTLSTAYWALLTAKNQCHKNVKLFFCSAYVPVCAQQTGQLLLPCRQFCSEIQKSCRQKMKSYTMPWPEALECNKLPDYKTEQCISPGEASRFGGTDSKDRSGCSAGAIECPSDLTLVSSSKSISVNRYTFLTTQDMDISHCGAPCEDGELFWSKTDRAIVRISIAVASALSLLTTAFAIATYCTDSTRFRYPEKPIIWLAACYFFISFAYLIGALTANDVSCKAMQTGTLMSNDQNLPRRRIVSQGTDSTDCTLTFMILYFFSIAVGVWWVILALTWLLAAGWKWSSEAIERISQYFHFAAWGLPTIFTLIILSQGKVDGDSLSGVCFTGQLDSAGLYHFVFLPTTVCLALGTFCLVIGFVALFRIRKNFKRSATTTGLYASSNSGPTDGVSSNHYDQRISVAKLEALMMKIGMFSIGYVIPASVVLACIYYETANYDDWIKSWLIQKGRNTSDATVPNYCSLQKMAYYDDAAHVRPSLAIFLTKYMVQLFCGTICGGWVWSMKTMHQWFNIFGCGTGLYNNSNVNNEMLYQRGSNVMSSTHQQSQKGRAPGVQTPGYQVEGGSYQDARGDFPMMPQMNGQQQHMHSQPQLMHGQPQHMHGQPQHMHGQQMH